MARRSSHDAPPCHSLPHCRRLVGATLQSLDSPALPRNVRAPMAGIVIKPRSRILHGHDWVYSSEVLKAWGDPKPGDVIAVKDGKDRMLGSAIYNPKSQIIARRFSRQRQDLDADFFHRRIAQAIAYRERRGLDPRLARLVWSESDGIPGLIVDRYGDHLVLQTLTLAMALCSAFWRFTKRATQSSQNSWAEKTIQQRTP